MKPLSPARRARIVDRSLLALVSLLAAAGGAIALIVPTAIAIVVALLGSAITISLVSLMLRTRSRGRLSAPSLEGALAEALRALAALESRADRLEKSVASSRSIARSADELPAWIELARRVPLGRAVFDRSVDPRALLALLDHAVTLPRHDSVLFLADDATGPLAARALLEFRPDLHPVIITSTDQGARELRADLGDDSRIELREGRTEPKSFGAIAGPWYRSDDLEGLDGIRLVLVAGPSHSHGPAARHAVVAGLCTVTAHATLVVCRPGDGPVARAVSLWGRTAPESVSINQISAWEVELRAQPASS